jgi:AcrR family transcriptional regulator
MSPKKAEPTPGSRERILEAALELFSTKGFSATGVRDIAAVAGVNLAMINYHFGSKAGLLQTVLDDFFDEYALLGGRFQAEPSEARPMRDVLAGYLTEIINLFRRREREVRILFLELHREDPSMTDYKARRMREIILPLIAKMQRTVGSPLPAEFLGPQVGGPLLFHFLLKPLVSRVLGATFDDDYYGRLPKVMAALILDGVNGTRDLKL